MRQRILLIDDIRNLEAHVIARTSQDGINVLERCGKFDVLMLDHDLGNESEGSGYDVACWLEANPQYLPDTIELVTANPVGRDNMAAVFKKFYNKASHGTIFSDKVPI